MLGIIEEEGVWHEVRLRVGSWKLEVGLSLHRLTQEHTGSKRFDALNQAAEASCSGLLMQLPNCAAKNLLIQGKEEVKKITGRWREEGACLCTKT